MEETQYYSSRIGDTTVQQTSHSTRATGLFSTEHTWSTTEARRRLFTPEELRTMARDEMLVLGSAAPPILVKTMSYERDCEVRHLADLPFVHATVRPEPADASPTSDQCADQLPWVHNRTRIARR